MPTHPTTIRRGITALEAARVLGVKKSTVYRLIQEGQLPAARISTRGDYRLDPRIVDDFLHGKAAGTVTCSQCGRPLSDRDEFTVVENLEHDEPIPQATVDEWLGKLGVRPGLVRDVGVATTHCVYLCAACSEHVPAEAHD